MVIISLRVSRDFNMACALVSKIFMDDDCRFLNLAELCLGYVVPIIHRYLEI